MDPGVRSHGMKANRTGYLWSKYECFLISGCQDMYTASVTRKGSGTTEVTTIYSSLHFVQSRSKCLITSGPDQPNDW